MKRTVVQRSCGREKVMDSKFKGSPRAEIKGLGEALFSMRLER